MRLFSKVKPGTAFVSDADNRVSAVDPEQAKARLVRSAEVDAEHESQVMLQAATVAVDASSIVSCALKARLESEPNVAELWANGNLGERDGLPDRKTRIYIPADQARPGGGITIVHTQQIGLEAARAKKKRKGKAERNRIKKEQEQALGSNVINMAAVQPATSV